jgi:hypothetical protein
MLGIIDAIRVEEGGKVDRGKVASLWVSLQYYSTPLGG